MNSTLLQGVGRAQCIYLTWSSTNATEEVLLWGNKTQEIPSSYDTVLEYLEAIKGPLQVRKKDLTNWILWFYIFFNVFQHVFLLIQKKLAPLGSLGWKVPQVLVSHPFCSDSEISSILSCREIWESPQKQVRLPKIRRKKPFIQFSSWQFEGWLFFSGFRWAEGDGLLTSTIRRQDLNSLWRLAVETKRPWFKELRVKGWNGRCH